MQQVEQTNQRPAVAETFRLKAFRVVTGELFAAATAQHALDMAKSELSRPQLSLKDVVAVSHSDLVVAEVNGAEHATGASVLLARATAPGLLGRCRTDHTYQTVFVEALSGPSLEWAVREASFKAFWAASSARTKVCATSNWRCRQLPTAVTWPVEIVHEDRPQDSEGRARCWR